MSDEQGCSRRSDMYRRRTILRAALGAAGAATLAACGGASSTPMAGLATASATTAVKPTVAPTIAAAASTPTVGPTATMAPTAARTATAAGSPGAGAAPQPPDGRLPSPAPGVPDAYTKYPPVFRSVGAVPGRGGRVSTFQESYSVPLPPRNENRYWQELERRFGVTLEPTLVPAGSYQEKLAAATASGDLPDLTFLHLPRVPDQNKVILQGGYTDLTPYLTGGALNEYPNLAAFPDYLWKNVAINGKIYGVPRPRFLADITLMLRRDWAAQVGRSAPPANAAEFQQLMVDFTTRDPDGNGKADTYGLGSMTSMVYSLPFFLGMFRVPNEWRPNGDGSLIKDIETDEFKAAIAYVRQLFAAGVYHPDAGTANSNQRKDGFYAGKYGAVTDGVIAVLAYRGATRKVTPAADVVGLVPPGHDGGKGVTYNWEGFFGFVAIPARAGRDKERVKELLRILDYYAAPFGSEERIFLDNGIAGVHHDVQPDGKRVVNDPGRAEINALPGLGSGQSVLYSDVPGDAAYVQGLIGEMVAVGVDNPALTAYSPTNAVKASELEQLRIDRLSAIITGRDPLSALDGYIQDWKRRGGDQIRKEYEEGLKGR